LIPLESPQRIYRHSKAEKASVDLAGSGVCLRVVVVSAHWNGGRCAGETQEESMFLQASASMHGEKGTATQRWSKIEAR